VSAHVDVIQTDWLAGQQVSVAEVHLRGEEILIDSVDAAKWTPIVERALDQVDGSLPPGQRVAGLSNVLKGSHLFATEAHEEGECPHKLGEPVPFESLPAEDRVPA
jgi:hypothetical protein